MGSKSSSKQYSSYKETNVVPTSTGDGNPVMAAATASGESTVNISLTDAGAINAGREIAGDSIDLARDAIHVVEGIGSATFDLLDSTFGTAYGVIERSRDATVEAVNDAAVMSVKAVQEANRSESSEQGRLLFLATSAVVGVVGIVMVARALKQ